MIIAVACLVVLVTPVRGDDFSTRREITRLYRMRNKAAMQGDLRAYMQYFTADFTVKRIDGGEGTRQEFETELHKIRAWKQYETTIEKLAVNRNRATAIITNRTLITFVDVEGRAGPKGKEYTIAGIGRARDTWVKTKQSWRLQRNQDLTPLR